MRFWFAVFIAAVILFAGCAAQGSPPAKTEQASIKPSTETPPLPPSTASVPMHVVKINSSSGNNSSATVPSLPPANNPNPQNPPAPKNSTSTQSPGSSTPPAPSSQQQNSTQTPPPQQNNTTQPLPLPLPISKPKLTVITHVINDNGGAASAGDFTMSVAANSPSAASFAGSENGVTVTLGTGGYDVSGSQGTGYDTSLSPGCTGTIAMSDSRVCTVTYNDKQVVPPPSGFSDDFSSYGSLAGQCLNDDDSFGPWNVVFAGYGCVRLTGTSLRETPQTSTTPSDTSSALVAGPSFTGPLTYETTSITDSQLRTGSPPNDWEVAWVLWHYTDNTHFYYFYVRSTGWELGKEDPAYEGNQRYLATGESPVFPIGQQYNIKITQDSSNTIKAYVNGNLITTFTDTERPYTSGRIALYDEDADVRFMNVQASQ